MVYGSVLEFLRAQVRGRPQSFEEIVSAVGKSRSSCWREINKLLLYGDVSVIVLRFNGRTCPFYTVREDVSVEVVRGPVLVRVVESESVFVVDRLT